MFFFSLLTHLKKSWKFLDDLNRRDISSRFCESFQYPSVMSADIKK